ncbi:uncharacterized protein LOC118193945 [Stegodyphus dumicola]|uniref:uncharacterized protein LOC118193945 n=1 Tax=Stegodyphus dumicola TaxID=202533 RepID=UPI0015A8E881|nr:uncharacterized protein LOC118193945 [Stegodyphus dumicola]
MRKYQGRPKKHPGFNKRSRIQRKRRAQEKNMKLNSRDVEDSEQADVFERSGSEKFDFSTPEVTANVPKTNQAFLSSDLDISVIDSDVEGRNTSSLLGLESEPLQENLNDEFLCPDSPLIIEREDRRKANPLPSGRTICNMSFVIVQARTLEQHSLNCKFGGSFIFNKVIRRGLVTLHITMYVIKFYVGKWQQFVLIWRKAA